MTAVRDPAFWRRFSVAVHLDEEKGPLPSENSSVSSRPSLKHTDTWLEKNRKKKRRTRLCGCAIALITILVLVAGAFALMYFLKIGLFSPHIPRNDREENYSATQAVNPIGT